MKRTINFFASLMVALVVAFSFVVNTSSAATISCPAKVTFSSPCTAKIDTGDLLIFSYNTGATLDVLFRNDSPINTAQVVFIIGDPIQVPLNIPPLGILGQSYSTGSFFSGTVKNQSLTQPTIVDVIISSSI